MRELTRPALFIVARTGLFLAVVTWIVAQWWRLEALYDRFAITLFQEGWLYHERGVPDFSVSCVKQTVLPHRVYEYWSNQLLRSFTSLIGLNVDYSYMTSWRYISLRHSSLVSILTVFNILLHILYRKRSEAAPCEN